MSYRGEAWVVPNQVGDFTIRTLRRCRRYDDRGYTLVTFRAGVVPLYSKWRTVDTWGLNNPLDCPPRALPLLNQCLREYKTEVIEFHAPFFTCGPSSSRPYLAFLSSWYSMLMTLKDYAEENELPPRRRVYGNDPCDAYYYYLRPGFPDSTKRRCEIRDLRITWKAAGWQIFGFLPAGNLVT